MTKAYGVLGLALATIFSSGAAHAADPQFDRGYKAVHSMAGCYLVDYSYTETEGLKPGYVRDSRVYDVNSDKSVKEWIYAEDVSPTRIRLQHVLFAVGLDGKYREGTVMKHTGEDWEFNAPFLYDFATVNTWFVKFLTTVPGQWARRVTNLDDGLRYGCAARWGDQANPEWSCDNYAPIPGRETRDMGRKDYNTLQRSTRLIAYGGGNWLERQANIKTIDVQGVKNPLARELGKTWYVKLPDTECLPAISFTEMRRPFWSVLREAWDEVFTGDREFIEQAPLGQPPRFVRMLDVEDRYVGRDLRDSATRRAAKDEILKLIAEYRKD